MQASGGRPKVSRPNQVLIGQVPPGGEVVVPTTIPIGPRVKTTGLRSRVQYDCVSACNGHVPAPHGRTVPVPVRSPPPRPSS